MRISTAKRRQTQFGGFGIGFVVGLLIGLALALGVALYVTKVPVPFINKVPNRGADQDAAEIERNRSWDPNAPLAGKPGARPASVPGPVLPPPETPAALPPAGTQAPAARGEAGRPPARGARDPAAILSGQAEPGAAARSTKPGAEPFSYFVQAGAYARSDDAEQQRARLAMLGLQARVTEREQSGHTVYRVRVGPYERKDDADSAQSRLQAAGVEAALVRVER